MGGFQVDWAYRGEFPDGSDEDDYKDFITMDNRSIAWEYLRRNPAYIKGWLQLSETGGWDASDADKLTALCERFGLLEGFCPNPYQRSVPFFATEVPINAPNLMGSWNSDGALFVRYGYIPAARPSIDVRLSLELPFEAQAAQIEHFWNKIRTEQKLPPVLRKPTEQQPEVHMRYCRILDALASGITSDSALADYLGMKEENRVDRVAKRRKAALALRDGGYQEIARLTAWREPPAVRKKWLSEPDLDERRAMQMKYKRTAPMWKKIKVRDPETSA